MLVVRALEAERAGLRPGLDDEVVRLLEALAVVGRVHAGGQLLLAAAAHEAGHEAAARDHVDHRQLLGQPHRVVGERERIAEQHQLHALGHRRQDRREDVALGLHAERRVVVLVQHDAVEADLFRELVVLEVLVVEAAARDGIEVLVGEHQRGGAEVPSGLFVVRRHRLLGEVHQMHGSGLAEKAGDERGKRVRLLHVDQVSGAVDQLHEEEVAGALGPAPAHPGELIQTRQHGRELGTSSEARDRASGEARRAEDDGARHDPSVPGFAGPARAGSRGAASAATVRSAFFSLWNSIRVR